jgi:hypothetical protein
MTDLLPTSTVTGFDYADPKLRFYEWDPDGVRKLRGQGDKREAIKRLRRQEVRVTAWFKDDSATYLVDEPEVWLWSLTSEEYRGAHIYDEWLQTQRGHTLAARALLAEQRAA